MKKYLIIALFFLAPAASLAYGGVGGIVPIGGLSVPIATPQVAGAKTECGVYMTSYIWPGGQNDPIQVTKLQAFLNQELNVSLEVNGVYNQATINRVKQFQLKYWDQVLLPWVRHGLRDDHTATGNVYKTTLWMVNLLSCPSNQSPIPQLP